MDSTKKIDGEMKMIFGDLFRKSEEQMDDAYSKMTKTEDKKQGIAKMENYKGDFLLWNMTDLEARDLCKHRIDAMERWSRRLIDETFKESYGDEYFEVEVTEGKPLIKNAIRRQVEERMRKEPHRFARKVDALVIEDLEYFFCRDDLYKNHFQGVFEPFFSGKLEIRAVINRISGVRNKIAHGNHLSQHELEQGVCYSNDFIGVFIDYYRRLGKEREYNVPTFLSVRDSFGRSLSRVGLDGQWKVYDWRFTNEVVSERTETHLRSGESYRLILEVDESFPKDFYEIKWKVTYGTYDAIASGEGNIIEFRTDDSYVSRAPTITVDLITKRSWHRFAEIDCDDRFVMHMSQVLPPVEDCW